jgi:carbamoyltransferase
MLEPGAIHAIGEERLSRRKNDGSFPWRAIDHVTEGAGVASVDLVVIDVNDGTTSEAVATLRQGGYAGEVIRVGHHLAHAAAAHFVCPDDGAAILVVDAGGTRLEEWPADVARPASFPAPPHDQEVQSFFVARGREIETLRQTFTRPGHRIGIGWLYGMTTVHLGFGPLDAGKTMGLAAHALEPEDDDILRWDSLDGDLLFPVELDLAEPATWLPYADRLFGGLPPRAPGEALTERHAQVAARLQRTTEAILLEMAAQLQRATSARTLCFSGGVALNVLANRRLVDESPFERVFVQPAASDSGIALGCALLGAIEKRCPIPASPEVSFLARAYASSEVARAVERCRGAFRVETPSDLLGAVVDRLAAGQVLGWFEGASELGPRSLGHRSLLADPRDPLAKERVNELVKHREAFRPFAPAVLEERAAESFDLSLPSPNMLLSARVRDGARDRIPAITHVDGSARVQTVSRRFPGRFRALLERWADHSGVPVLLNTSLNGPGEPIVESPDDAVGLFERSRMHALVLGDQIVSRS